MRRLGSWEICKPLALALGLVVVQITLPVSNLKWPVGRSTDADIESGQESRCVRYQMRSANVQG